MADDRDLRLFAPNLKLLHCTGTERVSSRTHDFIAHEAIIVGKLSNGRCLSHAIYSYNKDDGGMALEIHARTFDGEHVSDVLFDKRQGFSGRLDFPRCCRFSQGLHDLFRRLDAYVACNEDHFELIHEVLVQINTDPDQVFHALCKILAGLFKALT